MRWYFKCGHCGSPTSTEWTTRTHLKLCRECKRRFRPPTPASDRDAFVDGRDPPDEMRAIVLRLKGRQCTTPGCKRSWDALDHRIPFSKGGRTSVNNLWPMCNQHNESKGDADYLSWLVRMVANKKLVLNLQSR